MAIQININSKFIFSVYLLIKAFNLKFLSFVLHAQWLMSLNVKSSSLYAYVLTDAISLILLSIDEC